MGFLAFQWLLHFLSLPISNQCFLQRIPSQSAPARTLRADAVFQKADRFLTKQAQKISSSRQLRKIILKCVIAKQYCVKTSSFRQQNAVISSFCRWINKIYVDFLGHCCHNHLIRINQTRKIYYISGEGKSSNDVYALLQTLPSCPYAKRT